ncbi:serine hydrolase domain-containing protein [Terriglobus aquaticus]|uniref:Serine hydrolase domain-containing protein n=1 Tax=Terriglobus aquaticus TaxID=940139 RepID=A0ABW9KPN0_9BACT|nr:serine hydrolase domain-containing protein [Terriglobus aquaticus]
MRAALRCGLGALAAGAMLSAAAADAQVLHRLDGTTLSAAEAQRVADRELDANHVTGAEIAVLNGGKVVWTYAHGLRHRADATVAGDVNQPMTPETNTWAGSITKSVFATYVMQLAEQKKLELDVPVAKQLPKPLNEYEAYRESASELVKDPQWQRVTSRMLLAHAGGFSNLMLFTEQDKKLHLHSKPGTEFRYSGDGMNVVQFLVEQQQGKPLDVLMQEAIFGPLGMSQTSEIWQKRFSENQADRFDKDEKFHARTQRFPARASGNMSTSAVDMGKFLEALLAGRIVSRKTADRMFTPYLRITSVHEFPVAGDAAEGDEAKRVGLAYGMGWGLLTRTRYGPAFFKEGHGDGAQNYLICFRRSGDCMVILTNSDNGELAFRPLLEQILGDTETPWEWEGYTPEAIARARASGS